MRYRAPGRMVLSLIALCVGLAAFACLAQEPGWDCLLANSSPEANANPLHGITFHADRFVAVGDSGTVMVSTNPSHWFRQPTPTQSSLYGITAGGGQFVAIGDGGCVLLSTNGYDWRLSAPIPGKNLRAVAYGNGVYVVLTDQCQLLVSSDASAWQLIPQYAYPVGLYFGGNRFVAHGLNGLIMSSSDGKNWSAASLGVYTTFAWGAYGGGVFVVAGHEDFSNHQVAYSSDGVIWTAQTIGSPNGLWSGVCYGDGRFVGIDNNQVLCSNDGSSWGTCGGGFPAARLGAFGLGHYVALGERGLIYTSTNLYDWIVQSAPVCPMTSVAYGNGVYVGADRNSVYTSLDGVHFVQAPGPTNPLTPVTFAKGVFVAGANTQIVVSKDGTNWATFSAPCSDFVRSVKYGNNIWVGLCSGIISSADATNWTLQVENTGYLRDLAYGANRWVSWADNGPNTVIWSSPDGIRWEDSILAGATGLGPIAIRDGLFSLFRPTGYLVPETAFVSNDAVHWTDSGKNGPLLAIHQEDNSLLVSLAGKWGSTYRLQSSADLSHWSDSREIANMSGVTSLRLTNTPVEGAAYFRATQP